MDGISEVDCDRLRRYEGGDYVLMRGLVELPLGSPQSVLYFERDPMHSLRPASPGLSPGGDYA